MPQRSSKPYNVFFSHEWISWFLFVSAVQFVPHVFTELCKLGICGASHDACVECLVKAPAWDDRSSKPASVDRDRAREPYHQVEKRQMQDREHRYCNLVLCVDGSGSTLLHLVPLKEQASCQE
eukprot:939155-Amphidinium_carterae.1